MREQEHEGNDIDESAAEPVATDATAYADADLAGDEIAYSASSTTKLVLVGVIVVLSVVLVYGLTQGSAGAADGSVAVQGAAGEAGGACQGGACADCESGGAGSEPIVAGTFVEEDHQWIDVNVSGEYFDPNVIVASAGMPIKINFGEGSGCMSEVQFYDFPVREDLTSGGAIVDLPALEPGEYAFACGAEAVYGLLIVQ